MKPRIYRYRGVRYVAPWRPAPDDFARCLSCGRAWDDKTPTSLTPAPSARCPFEYWHKRPRRLSRDATIWAAKLGIKP